MAFSKTSQAFKVSVNKVEIGTGEKKITLGGENVFPLYTFDAPIENRPCIGVEVSDLGLVNPTDELAKYYEGCTTVAEIAKKASEIEGADFVCLFLDSADPNGENRSVEDCAKTAEEVAEAIDCPLVVAGCKNAEKNADLLNKVSDILQGKNILVLAAKEENYKTIGASAGLAYNQKVGAESAVDINLAKQLNVVLNQLGVKDETIVMNVGTATAGYGYEYVASTMDRIKAAALAQGDTSLLMPIITPVSTETWNCKESLVSEEDFPEWGDRETRGIDMEIATASADLVSGSNAVIMRHPTAIATIAKMIKELM